MWLGLSIDAMDDLDDELLARIDGISFIAEDGFRNQHGDSFAISMGDGGLALEPAKPVEA